MKAALAPVSDEMLQSTPSLGQLVGSIHSGLDVDRLSMVYVGFSMEDARQLCEDAAAEANARTPGQVLADLQRGNIPFWMGTSNREAAKAFRGVDVHLGIGCASQ